MKILHIPTGRLCRVDIATLTDRTCIAILNNNCNFSAGKYMPTITKKDWEAAKKQQIIVWAATGDGYWDNESGHVIDEFELLPNRRKKKA